MITAHLRAEIEELYENLVTFSDGMMLVGGDLPKGVDALAAATSLNGIDCEWA
jgi:hypothetical protein